MSVGTSRTRRATDRGAAALELALVLPILLVLVSAIFDVGRLLAAQITLHEAAQERAVFAGFYPESATKAETRVRESTGELDDVTVTCNGNSTVHVRATRDVDMVTPIIGGTWTLSAESESEIFSDSVCESSA